LNATRTGQTYKIVVGEVTVYVTLNRDDNGKPKELFAKADEGYQGWIDVLMLTASLALRNGCDFATILNHWRHQRFEPAAFGCSSIPDAIAKRIQEEGSK
jgi:hypothetical protein